MSDKEKVEVLRLSIETMQEGTLFFKEFSYGSDDLVYTKTSWLIENHEEDGWHSEGWKCLSGPDGNPICITKSALAVLAETARKKKWFVSWNPEYDPLFRGFRKEVKF